MSNKFYRTMPRPDPAPAMPQAPAPAMPGAPAPATPADAAVTSAEDAALINGIKRFLGKVLEKATKALDQLESTTNEKNESNWTHLDWRNQQISALARIGVSASKTLMQAIRMNGANHKDFTTMLRETAIDLEQKLKDLAPPRPSSA
jgi:hypothetical protein